MPNAQFGVSIVCQGVVQRRTVVQNRPSNLAPWLSPRIRKSSSSTVSAAAEAAISASASSLSTTSSRPLMHARPAGFSTWRRYWATLVLVGQGSAAFLIYFEPKSKNAIQRNQVGKWKEDTVNARQGEKSV